MNSTLFQGKLVESKRIIYTPSDFAKSNLIHLQEIGQLQAQSTHTSKRQNLSSYLFFMVLKGSGIIDYNGMSYDLLPGDCVFIDCRKSYLHRTSEDLWNLKWIHFNGPNMSSIYDKYVERGGLPTFHPNSLAQYENTADELIQLASSMDYIRDMRVYEKLTQLLTLLMEESWNPNRIKRTSYNKQNLQSIKDYIDEHYTEKIKLEEIAEKFYINKFYLTRIYKQQFGVSLYNYLLQKRITHAKQLLRFTDLSIEVIGQECGMDDPNYFSRMFKKVEGVSPGEFRRMW